MASLDSANVEGMPVHVITPAAAGRSAVAEVLLSSWEAVPADVIWCLSPSVRFLRPFGAADLMATPETPYAFLTEDAERLVDPQTAAAASLALDGVRAARADVGLDDRVLRSCPGNGLLAARVLETFRDGFLAPRGWTYADALERVPDPLAWYSAWLQRAHSDEFVAREPIILSMASADDGLRHALRQSTTADLARSYVAVDLLGASTLADAAPGTSLPRYRLVAEHARPGELLTAWWLRLYRRLPSLQRLVARLRRRRS